MENIVIPQGIGDKLFQILATVVLIILLFIFRSLIKKLVHRQAERNQFDITRALYIKKLSIYLLFLFILILIAGTWEISFKGLSLGFASVFTVIGVALFAHWSILSNLTASLILFFFFPYKIGVKITVLEGDNSISGTILDISLFYILIKTTENKEISIPNSIILQKSVRQD